MYPPIKRFRTDENQDESNDGMPIISTVSSTMVDDFEMTDDELLFTATQVERQTNSDYYQGQPVSQNPSRVQLQAPVFSTQSVLQPLPSDSNRTQSANKELELERKLLLKESQIIILEKNNRLLSEKNARLTREKCLLKTEQDEAASAREQRLKTQLETCKSQLTFNERERSELQTRFHSLETRLHESQETSTRLLREVTRLRNEKPQLLSQQTSQNAHHQQQQQQPQQQQQQLQQCQNQQQLMQSVSHRYRLLQTQLTQFSAYELLRTRSIDSSTMVISSLQVLLDHIRPQSITRHIWQTLIDLIFFHQQQTTPVKTKQEESTIGVDLLTMTAFYQMISNLLQLYNNQLNRITADNRNQNDEMLTDGKLTLILDACHHFLLNTVKSTESVNKQENSTAIKRSDIDTLEDLSSQRSNMEASQIPCSTNNDHHTGYYTAKGQCLAMLKYCLSHSTNNKYSFSLFNRILQLYTYHFKTHPAHESERRKAFCTFLISLLDQTNTMETYQFLTSIVLSLLDASPDEPSWLCSVMLNDDRSTQRCLCSILVVHLDGLLYFDDSDKINDYHEFLYSIYRLQLFTYRKETFHRMELDNGQCPGLCWLSLFLSLGQCLSRFLFQLNKPSSKEQMFRLSVKFVKLLILFSLQIQPTTCLPQQAKELQLYTNPSLWHLYELMILYRHEKQQKSSNSETNNIIHKQVLDDETCVFAHIHDVFGSTSEIR